MFLGLTARLRRRAGAWLALGYFACIIASSLSLCFADAAAAAHCLLDEFHMVAPVPSQGEGSARYQTAMQHAHAAMMHDHAGMTHAHGTATPDGLAASHDHGAAVDHGLLHGEPHQPAGSPVKSAQATCCGLFCVTGTAAAFDRLDEPAANARSNPPLVAAHLGGLGPHRIDRPPIILASA
jgi:hypothetical protein